MTVQEIQDYIQKRIASTKTKEFINNYKEEPIVEEPIGEEPKLYSAEEVREELIKILSMLDELEEKV